MKIYDLEQTLCKYFSITDDIELLLEAVMESKGIDPRTQDEISNILVGLEAILRLRESQVWKEYNEALAEYHQMRRGMSNEECM